MLPLPLDVLRLVYAFDPMYSLCLLELEVLFGEHRFPRRVLRRMRVERVLWACACGRHASGVELDPCARISAQ
jgi:hypothetical protein